MILPKELEPLADMKIWLCHPLIPNPDKHGGVGGYDKPPINPHTLYPAYTNNPASLGTFDEANVQIGNVAKARLKGKDDLVPCEVAGVGIAFSGTGICGIDLDNVADGKRRVMTSEAHEILGILDTYTELSPSGTGLHGIFLGELPEGITTKLAARRKDIFKTYKAEYQLFDSGYMTISGNSVGSRTIAERTAQVAEVYEQYFREIEPIASPSTRRPAGAPSVVSCNAAGYTYERWLVDVRRLSDKEILERIFASGSTGEKVEALYGGDLGEYNNDHSRGDLALCSYLYGFTNDRDLTERLFRTSGLYRATGKSRNYLRCTLDKAAVRCKPLVGHIEFTEEERRAYAKKKQDEEDLARAKRLGYSSLKEYRDSFGRALRGRGERRNSHMEEGGKGDRRKI